MPIAVFMLSARGREGILAGTLASWDATDWGGRPRLVLDPAPEPAVPPVSQQRMQAAWRSLLAAAVDFASSSSSFSSSFSQPERDGEPFLLLLEDDLAFARHLRAALRAWPPLRALGPFASLYDPGIPGVGTAWPAARAAKPAGIQGAQALLLRPDFARHALRHWEEMGGHVPSRRFALLAARDFPGEPLYYHRPSLIQHTATLSAWGAPLHRAKDFEEHWQP